MLQLSTSTYNGAKIGFYKHHLAIPLFNPRSLQLEIPLSRICLKTLVSCPPASSSKVVTHTSWWAVDTSLGYFYYINVVNFNTEWEVFVDGVSQNTYSSNSSGFSNCTYIKSSNMIHTQVNLSENITVVVHGPETESQTLERLSTSSDPWSLEVNMLL